MDRLTAQVTFSHPFVDLALPSILVCQVDPEVGRLVRQYQWLVCKVLFQHVVHHCGVDGKVLSLESDKLVALAAILQKNRFGKGGCDFTNLVHSVHAVEANPNCSRWHVTCVCTSRLTSPDGGCCAVPFPGML